MQNPQKDSYNQDPSAKRQIKSQTVKTGKDSNSSAGRGLSSSKNKQNAY